MTSRIEWRKGRRDCPVTDADNCLLALDTADVSAEDLTPVWEKVSDDIVKLCTVRGIGSLVLASDVWPSSGRVVFVAMLKRELYRFDLVIPKLDEAFHKLPDPDDPSFDVVHDLLVDNVANPLALSFEKAGLAAVLKPYCQSLRIHRYNDTPALKTLM